MCYPNTGTATTWHCIDTDIRLPWDRLNVSNSNKSIKTQIKLINQINNSNSIKHKLNRKSYTKTMFKSSNCTCEFLILNALNTQNTLNGF